MSVRRRKTPKVFDPAEGLDESSGPTEPTRTRGAGGASPTEDDDVDTDESSSDALLEAAGFRTVGSSDAVQLVLRRLKGESLTALSRESGIPPDHIAAWEDDFLMAGIRALTEKMQGVTRRPSSLGHASTGQRSPDGVVVADTVVRESDQLSRQPGGPSWGGDSTRVSDYGVDEPSFVDFSAQPQFEANDFEMATERLPPDIETLEATPEDPDSDS